MVACGQLGAIPDTPGKTGQRSFIGRVSFRRGSGHVPGSVRAVSTQSCGNQHGTHLPGNVLHGGGYQVSLSVRRIRMVAAVPGSMDLRAGSDPGVGGRDHGVGALVPRLRRSGIPDVGVSLGGGIDENLLAKPLLPGGFGDLFDDLDAGGAQIQRGRLARPRPKPAAKRSVLGALPFARAVGDRVLLRRGCQAERRLAVGRGAGAVVPREGPGHGALRTVSDSGTGRIRQGNPA